jgi:hypothetical protein
MRPRGTRKFFHQRLKRREKKAILARLRSGEKQIEVAREFGTCPETIREIRKAAGLRLFRPLTPALEREIVTLLRQGFGQRSVSKLTKISERKIRRIMREHKIFHRTGDPGLPQAKHLEILGGVRARRKFANRLAQELRVSSFTVLRTAHAIYGPHRFRNRGKPLTSAHHPDQNIEENCLKFLLAVARKRLHLEKNTDELLSRYAQRNGGRTMLDQSSTEALYLMDSIVREYFRGTMPQNHVRFAESLAKLCLEKIPREVLDSLDPDERGIIEGNFCVTFIEAAERLRKDPDACRHGVVN